GVIGPGAIPTPLYFARRLCAQYIQYGDAVVLPALDGAAGLDGIVVQGRNGRSSALLVHCEPTAATYNLDEVTDGQVGDGRTLIKIDCDTGNTATTRPCDGSVTFAGYGVGVVTNEGRCPCPLFRALRNMPRPRRGAAPAVEGDAQPAPACASGSPRRAVS